MSDRRAVAWAQAGPFVPLRHFVTRVVAAERSHRVCASAVSMTEVAADVVAGKLYVCGGWDGECLICI